MVHFCGSFTVLCLITQLLNGWYQALLFTDLLLLLRCSEVVKVVDLGNFWLQITSRPETSNCTFLSDVMWVAGASKIANPMLLSNPISLQNYKLIWRNRSSNGPNNHQQYSISTLNDFLPGIHFVFPHLPWIYIKNPYWAALPNCIFSFTTEAGEFSLRRRRNHWYSNFKLLPVELSNSQDLRDFR